MFVTNAHAISVVGVTTSRGIFGTYLYEKVMIYLKFKYN